MTSMKGNFHLNEYPCYLDRSYFFNEYLFLKKAAGALSGIPLFTAIKEPFVSSQKHHVYLWNEILLVFGIYGLSINTSYYSC